MGRGEKGERRGREWEGRRGVEDSVENEVE